MSISVYMTFIEVLIIEHISFIGGDILQLGQNKAALKDAEAALGENPREVGASIVAGQAAAGLGQLKEAFLKYKIGLQQDPNNKVLLNSVVV